MGQRMEGLGQKGTTLVYLGGISSQFVVVATVRDLDSHCVFQILPSFFASCVILDDLLNLSEASVKVRMTIPVL